MLAGLFLITGLAGIGFPGTVGFVGLELLVKGTIQAHALVGATVVIVAALNGLAVMRLYFRIFTGRPHVASIDLSVRPAERISVLVVTALILGAACIPSPALRPAPMRPPCLPSLAPGSNAKLYNLVEPMTSQSSDSRQLDVLAGDLARGAGTGPVGRPVEPPLVEAPAPLADSLGGNTELGGDVLVVQAVGAGQNDPGALSQLLVALGSAGPGLQALALAAGEDRFGFASA
jgi:hypothetical protein